MKRLLICISIILSFSCAMSQTVTVDTLFVGTPQTDTLDGDLIDCYVYSCSPEKSHEWFLPNAAQGVIDIAATPDLYEVIVIVEGSFVVIDTCLQLFDYAGGEFRLIYTFSTNVRIIVNGPANSIVNAKSKVEPSPVFPLLPDPIIDLDTLCLPTNTMAQYKPCERSNYISITTLQEYHEQRLHDLPRGVYWQYCEDRRVGQKILVP